MSRKRVPETKWCAYCGVQVPNGALFCPHCGEPIDPNYVYDEDVSSEEAVIKEDENPTVYEIIPTPSPPAVSGASTPVLYEGTIRGLVTKGSMLIHTSVFVATYPPINFLNPPSTNSSSPLYDFSEVCFAMRQEEGFEGVPEEILVLTSKFGYFDKGDEVVLQGKLFKTNLSRWSRPMFDIVADHYYNESLQIGDGGLTTGKLVFKGMIRGSVTKESRAGLLGNEFYGNYFVIRLEENIGIGGVPSEILVHCKKHGYFGKGDKVILQGRILEMNLRRWNRPMYIIEADQFYNESLQIGEAKDFRRMRVLHGGLIRGSVTEESIMMLVVVRGVF